MNKIEAIQAMLDGEKVINENARVGRYLHYSGDNFRNKDGEERDINGDWPDNWSIYEEPKPKKEKWILWQKDCGKKKPKKFVDNLEFMDEDRTWQSCNGSTMRESCVYRYKK